MEKIVIGRATLYHGDCMEVLPMIDRAYALITDPEYGHGYKVNRKRTRASSLDWKALNPADQVDPVWPEHENRRPFDPSHFLDFRQVVIWGANHFSSRLPDASCWLVWDKKVHTAPDNHSDCELAYTNLPGPVRKFSHLWRGLVRAGEENISRSKKLHPWQKPLRLMAWCVAMTQGVVFDPFMGSGTTGVAAVQADREFIGVEIIGGHFETACERIEQAQKQQRLAL